MVAMRQTTPVLKTVHITLLIILYPMVMGYQKIRRPVKSKTKLTGHLIFFGSVNQVKLIEACQKTEQISHLE